MRSLTLVALIAVPAFAQTVYSWEDEEGTHYTDDLSQVPRTSRQKVEAQVIDARPASAGLVSKPAPAQATLAMAPVAPGPSANEAEWRQRFIEARRRIDTVRQGIVALEANLPPRTECVPQPMNVVTSGGAVIPNGQFVQRCQVNPMHDRLRVQIAQQGVELKNAELDLEQLERWASMYSIPREWRRGW